MSAEQFGYAYLILGCITALVGVCRRAYLNTLKYEVRNTEELFDCIVAPCIVMLFAGLVWPFTAVIGLGMFVAAAKERKHARRALLAKKKAAELAQVESLLQGD